MCKVAVVIPFYTNEINAYEIKSMQQCMKVLRRYDIYLLVPTGFLVPTDVFYSKLNVKTMPKECFVSVQSYNKMMLSKEVYELFGDYEYMLIYQLDAFVFSDRLLEFCKMDYDYIGAPWIKGVVNYQKEIKPLFVGNGGFSLRKIQSFIMYLANNKIRDYSVQEDVFWAGLKDYVFRIPSVEVAASFALEGLVAEGIKMNGGKIPFGCHAWTVYSFEFWKKIIQKNGYVFEVDDHLQPYDENRIADNRFLDLDKKELKKVLADFIEQKNILIWGAGRWGLELGFLFEKINVRYSYIDSSKHKQGEQIKNKRIFPLNILRTMDNNDLVCILAFSDAGEEELNTLDNWHINRQNVFFYREIRKKLVEEFKKLKNIT